MEALGIGLIVIVVVAGVAGLVFLSVLAKGMSQ